MEKQLIDIYALKHPETGEVRYIGKANNAQKRLQNHLREKRRKTPLYNWIAKLAREGMHPALEVIAQCPANQWQDTERKAIADARAAGVRLLNVADGGDEPYCPPEVRAANGRKAVQSRVSTPEKARMWRLKQELGALLSLGYVSEKTKEKLRALAARHPGKFHEWSAL